MHFLLHLLARRFSPSFARKGAVFQVVAAVLIGAGLGWWFAMELPEARQYLVQVILGGMAVAFIASIFLLVNDATSAKRPASRSREGLIESRLSNPKRQMYKDGNTG